MNGYEFEEQLIGSMLIKGDHIDCHDIAGKLPVEAFDNHHLREMYKAITKLLTKCEPIDMFSVQYAVPEDTRPMVLDVAARCQSAANIKPWAKRVRQCWMLRKGQRDLMQAASILSEAGPHDINEKIAEAVALISSLTFETSNKLPRKIADILPDYLDVLDKRYDGDKSGLYLQVGITPLDEKYGGFDRTDLIVIAGQPGMGKTELAIMMANHIGSQRGNRGLFVSMEMSDVQIVERHVADRACLPISKLRNPLTLEEYEKDKMHACIGGLIDQENYVLDATLTVDEIINHAERMAMEDGGLSFLAIDYLGLVKKGKAERNDLAIADITRKLKSFALKNKVPVLLLSQLNRKAAERGDKRPIIQDLRDSGSIEQDADVIIFPYREEVHKENTPMKGIAEIIVAKYRSGEPATAYMQWVNGHFKNMDQVTADNIKRSTEQAVSTAEQSNGGSGWAKGKK
ncbi:MAG: replicative DNA helicase [Shewanella sp.]